jgi:hypothetical protein
MYVQVEMAASMIPLDVQGSNLLFGIMTSVNRCGEFSPLERLFSLSSFWKTTEGSKNVRQLFSTVQAMY